MKNRNLKPTTVDWLITIFEFPAVIFLCLAWALRIVQLTLKSKMENETTLESFVRVVKTIQDTAAYSIYRWKMFITVVFYSSLILFMIFL
jgi:hypothetical protein